MIRDVLTLAQLQAMPADEAAALWTVRLAEGEFPHEREVFEQWLDLAPDNRAAWKKAQDCWNVFDGAQGDEVLEAMRLHARSAAPAKNENWRGFAAAAALVLAIGTASIVADRAGMFGPSGSGSEGQVAVPATAASLNYANGRELPKLVTLPDGSRMTLDAETRVTAIFRPEARDLQLLSGRAYFAVQHDSARPFVVRARDIAVTAIGTRFDVRLGRGDVRVMLSEGRLSVKTAQAAARPLIMSAGQQLIAKEGASPTITRSTGEALDWQQGYATFEDETLVEAADVLNRYPGDQLIVRDPRVTGLRISGNFKVGNAERFASTLKQIYPVRVVRRSPNKLEILPAG